ncbi:MAG: DAK2 domain-containing protein, partial [Bacillota bacterium]
MLDAGTLKIAMRAISDTMKNSRSYLIELDQRNGDGDLGISMDEGFAAACASLDASGETDLGKLMIGAGKAFNEVAPSSLGTILSFMMMGM